MSGIAGIVNFDGAPVQRALLNRMAAHLECRGPDRTGIWAENAVGLVHTLFATTEEAKREQLPMSLDGQSWITADARIDARSDLIAELRGHGRDCSLRSTDPELILHAYSVWGEQCLEHLVGDFAFAIWDEPERKLFCARDHFGVRPFFYAKANGTLVISNSMDMPRLLPDFPDDLNEQTIAEYLVIGSNSELHRTARQAIWRLPPAHVLVVAGGEVRVRRYWTLPVDPPTVFRRSNDYVEHFFDLFEKAVSDRLRTGRVAVLMSGGMDSSSVAAMAKRLASQNGCAISAHTQSYHRLLPHDEGPLAKLVARSLDIPWREFLLDDRKLFGLAETPEFRRQTPEWTPVIGWLISDVLGKPLPARVFLTGQGSDGIFSSFRLRHCRERIRNGQWLPLAREVMGHLLCEGRIRRLRILPHVRNLLAGGVPPRPFPDWLNPDLERRLDLRAPYERYEVNWREQAANCAVRPEAYNLIGHPLWVHLLETHDPNGSGVCIEARHPFFDLRLVRYVLSLPALPWCSDKELLRRSMRRLLPNEIRLARKRPLVGDPLPVHYRSTSKQWLDGFQPAEGLNQFVNVPRALERVKNSPPSELTVHLRPFNLNYWLKWESRFAYSLEEECSVRSH